MSPAEVWFMMRHLQLTRLSPIRMSSFIIGSRGIGMLLLEYKWQLIVVYVRLPSASPGGHRHDLYFILNRM